MAVSKNTFFINDKTSKKWNFLNKVLSRYKMVFVLILFILLGSAKKDLIDLPSPKYKGTVSVEEAIFKRRSIRRYKPEPLKIEEVSQILWSAGGVTCDGVTGPTRAYPSAGACHPLEIYLVCGMIRGLEPGVYKYLWDKHKLQLLKSGDFRKDLMYAAYGQSMVGQAPASIVFTAIFERTTWRYGERGRVRYVPMDLGHAGQNVHLQCEALGLGTVIIGAFVDAKVQEILGIKKEEIPLYIMPIGKPER